MDVHDAAQNAAGQLRDQLALMAADWLTWPRLQQELVKQGAPDPLTVEPVELNVRRAVERLLDPARPAHERERTAVALRLALASHPKMGLVWLGAGGAAHAGAALAEPDDAMQAMLAARDDIFARWHEFQQGMQRVGLTMCQIWVRQQFTGSGFLIGDRYVLTAYHCVEQLIDNGKQRPYAPNALYVVFDDLVIPGQTRSSYRTEIAADSDWLVHCSPPDSGERTATAPLHTLDPQCLDFAVIRLAQPAGSMAPKHLPSIERKWIALADLAATPQQQAQMLIAHYPGGADLRLAVGLFGDHAASAHRVRYYTPTIVGSSGAPCFSVEWKPYALHNAGYQACNTNQGVPLTLIWNALGRGARLASAPSASPYVVPPVDAAGMPILGRTGLFDTVAAAIESRGDTRILSVTGADGGGKTYTAQLVRTMLLDRGCQVFLLDAGQFAADTPEQFAYRLIAAIGGKFDASEQPDAPDTRQRARWISGRLAEWARQELERAPPNIAPTAAARGDSAWIILDDCQPALLSPETNDLLVALLGEIAVHATGQLRVMLTGYDGNLLSLPQGFLRHTELDLVTANACLPYMDYTLSLRETRLDEEKLKRLAAEFADFAEDCNVSTLPQFSTALKRWWERWCTSALGTAPPLPTPAPASTPAELQG